MAAALSALLLACQILAWALWPVAAGRSCISSYSLGDLPPSVGGHTAGPAAGLVDLPEAGCNLDNVLSEVERRLPLQALERTGGVRTTAAKLLGVTFRSFRYRLSKYGLAPDDVDEDTPLEPVPSPRRP